jgi:DNA-binding response OmpR family regulator
MTQPANILIVEDTETNRDLLCNLIFTLGHTPSVANNGVTALAMIHERPPDLVLLDILMPEMDGYEVLRKIKEHFSLRHLPVIVISAIDEMESIVRCIQTGADDYLTKPFNLTLLRARIDMCLNRKHLIDREENYRRFVESYNLDLEERVQKKTRELEELHEKLKILDKAKSDFLKLISHELRTPLTGMLGLSEVLFDKHLKEEKRQQLQEMFKISLERLADIVKQASLLTQIEISKEIFSIKANPINILLEESLKAIADFAEFRQVSIVTSQHCNTQVLSDKELFVSALSALLKTAIRFSAPGKTVNLTCEQEEEQVIIVITSEGQIIPAELISRFFEVFSVVDSVVPGDDIGLGPPVAERIVALFDGSISVENMDSEGIRFSVALKRVDSKQLSVERN